MDIRGNIKVGGLTGFRGGSIRKLRQIGSFCAVAPGVRTGANVVFMDGLKVGPGAVLAAGAVVSKDVLPYQVPGGVPARHLKFRFDDATIQRPLAIRWWDHAWDSMSGIAFDDIQLALDELESPAANGLLVRRTEKWFIIPHRAPWYTSQSVHHDQNPSD